MDVMVPVGTKPGLASSTGSMTARSPLARLAPVQGAAEPAQVKIKPVRQRVPRRPDARIVVGSLLVLLSALVGVRAIGKPETAVTMWSATRDLPAGTVIDESDVSAISIAGPVPSYVPSTEVVIGQRLAKPVAGGELIHSTDIAVQRIAPATRLVTIPVDALHAPTDLERGHRVDVWSTPVIESVISAPQLVLANLFVAQVPSLDERGISSSLAVTLEVPVEAVGAVIAALRSGDVDIVRVPVVNQ